MDRSMVPYKKNRFRRSWPWWRWCLTGLIAIALALSAYLSWHSLVGGSVIGCDGGSSCDQVLSSRWSTIGGVVPVSGLAAGAYLAMFVASFSLGPNTSTPVRRLAWDAMLVLVGAAAGSAVWFFIVQKWYVGAFCPYCTAAHITGLLMAVLVIWQAFKQFNGDPEDVSQSKFAQTTDAEATMPTAARYLADTVISAPIQVVSPVIPQRIIALLPAIGLPLVGLAFAGILAACQLSFTPPAVYQSGNSQDNLPAINTSAVPLVGSPDAAYIVTLFFDYKCRHCQQLHFMIEEAIRRYEGKLAFVLRPAPLNSRCNPYIPRDIEEFKDSCELVKIGLAVWVAKREAFPLFNRWMFTMESGDFWTPRNLDDAKAKAVELVGQDRFDAAFADPWIDRYMKTSIRIFGNTGINAIPKFVFGSRWVTPEIYEVDNLISLLHTSLALPEPTLKIDSIER